MISPYSQGDTNFKSLAKVRADSIFSDYTFYKDVKVTNEIIFSNANFFEKKYKNKKILIFGGGPSTNIFFQKGMPMNYDFLWSVNHFFLNPYLRNVKIDLAMIMLEPNIFSKDFINYYNEFRPILGFELHDKWKSVTIPYKECFVMQTRFYGILGACQRMIIFAALLGVQQVDFVGLDGLSAIRNGDHSFQPGKKTLPSISSDVVYDFQYQELWKYLYNFRNKTKFNNLSKLARTR